VRDAEKANVYFDSVSLFVTRSPTNRTTARPPSSSDTLRTELLSTECEAVQNTSGFECTVKRLIVRIVTDLNSIRRINANFRVVRRFAAELHEPGPEIAHLFNCLCFGHKEKKRVSRFERSRR
jgi:hypothetical protein